MACYWDEDDLSPDTPPRITVAMIHDAMRSLLPPYTHPLTTALRGQTHDLEEER